jgi:hypothetical protein
MKQNADGSTSITIPRDLRVRLDEVRLARARRTGQLSPPLKTLVVEALQALADAELRA